MVTHSKKTKVEEAQPELPLDLVSTPEPVTEVVAETPEVVVVEVKEPERVFVGATLPSTADEQLAGQIAIASAEERLKAEIEVGKKAVADAEARMRAAG